MRYDGLGTYFRRVTECAGELLQSALRRRNVSKPRFPIDTAVLTPLFFTGFCCRDWTIRRDALQLLDAWGEVIEPTNSRERVVRGMKRSALERLIDIESEGLQPGSVIPEPARIRYVRVAVPPGSLRAHISYLRSSSAVFENSSA